MILNVFTLLIFLDFLTSDINPLKSCCGRLKIEFCLQIHRSQKKKTGQKWGVSKNPLKHKNLFKPLGLTYTQFMGTRQYIN